jgi:hypothetical protein
VPAVATEDLIAAVSGQHDLDGLPREARELEDREGRRVVERLVVDLGRARERGGEIADVQKLLAVSRPVGLRRDPRVADVVQVAVPVSHGERRERRLGSRRRARDDRRRIQAAGQERPEGTSETRWDVTALSSRDRSSFDVVRDGAGLETPVPLEGDGVPCRRRRAAGARAAVSGCRRRSSGRRERSRKRESPRARPVEARRETRQLQESLRLGGEAEAAGQRNVVQGLDPDAVAREEERPIALVPQSQGEHPLDRGQSGRPFAAQEAVRDLAVALRDEDLAERLEAAAQLPEVVELPVVDERRLPVRGDRRLLAADGGSRIASRRWPRRRGGPGSIQTPAPSGPRRFSVARARSITAGSIPAESIQPAIPHMRPRFTVQVPRITDYAGNGYMSQATARAPTTSARKSLTKRAVRSRLPFRQRSAKKKEIRKA